MRKGHPTQSEEETARRTRVSVPELKRMERRQKTLRRGSDGGSKITLTQVMEAQRSPYASEPSPARAAPWDALLRRKFPLNSPSVALYSVPTNCLSEKTCRIINLLISLPFSGPRSDFLNIFQGFFGQDLYQIFRALHNFSRSSEGGVIFCAHPDRPFRAPL